MKPMTCPRVDGQGSDPLYIHRPCLTTICWGQEMVREYGPIADQDCDCETFGPWFQIYIEDV